MMQCAQFSTQRSCLDYISLFTKKKTIREVQFILINHFLPHMDKKKQEIKFQAPTSLNPFSNILLLDKTNKFPAPPIENIKVKDDILIQTKKTSKKETKNLIIHRTIF